MIWKWWKQEGRSRYYLEEASNLASSNGTETALVIATVAQAHATLALAEAVSEVAQIIHNDLEILNKSVGRMK